MTYHAEHYQDQGFVPADQANQKALTRANEQLREAVEKTPVNRRSEYRSVIRWERDGYGWYWIVR